MCLFYILLFLLSLACRSGGGIIMNYYFRYLECGRADFKTPLPFCNSCIPEPSLAESEFNVAAILPSGDTSILRCSTPDLCPLDYFSPIGSPQNLLPATVGIVTPESHYDAMECLELLLPPPLLLGLPLMSSNQSFESSVWVVAFE